MTFSASDAAFEGFRLVRRKPMALVAWTLLYAVLSLAGLFAMSSAIDPLVAWAERMEGLESTSPATPEEVLAAFQGLGEVMLSVAWLIPVSLIVGAMLMAAVARAVLNPRAGGFGYLRLGMDELRVFVVTLVLTILMTFVCFAVFMLIGVLAGIAGASGANWMWLFVILGGLVGVAAIIWLAVRLSLAVPITVAENRFAFFDSFGVTAGRFWPLFGMAVITIVMVIVVQLLLGIVTMPLALMTGQEMWSFGGHQDPEALRRALDITNPWIIASALAEAVVYALTVGVMYAPFAAAYRDIKGLGAETPTA
ncbi:hypothetical protein [Brevundimonas sp.]|uniref:hypothetical protein n=1 Tax=Brevundimonas sp. TaxID=1871086 RepID=UPI002D5838C1|nr:hypothetical protein [Brevundimonas sp.]HYC73756.1 hypothetical protein [Brevundimonas sp.]